MKVEDLKWYSPFLFLLGAILSFADPITDILTLVEFYRTDHKTWFGVGLAFVVLPCLLFLVIWVIRTEAPHEEGFSASLYHYAKALLCGFNPFSAALVRIEGFLLCLKKWWCGDEIDSDNTNKAEDVLTHIDVAVLFEAVLESAPQFILQLYAISVQEEPVTIIQIISLPVSFLSLAWAFTTADGWILPERGIISSSSELTVKHKIAFYVTHLLFLSSRLFAICYFTVSYKWWVIGVLLFHTFVVVATAAIQYRGEAKWNGGTVFFLTLFIGIHCLRDDIVDFVFKEEPELSLSIVLLSHVLFVLENFFMILMFYFSPHFNTWYSLPVTVCVCVFSVLGSIMRITLLLWLRRETTHSIPVNSDNVSISINSENSAYPSAPQAENNDNSAAGIVRVIWESTV